jgi:hypothetical protein
MIATINPSAINTVETVTTLRYAACAHKVENRPVIEEGVSRTLRSAHLARHPRVRAFDQTPRTPPCATCRRNWTCYGVTRQ